MSSTSLPPDGPSGLERRLRERRYEQGARACADVLDGIGVATSAQHAVPLDDLELIWPPYVDRLREISDTAERWSPEQREEVQHRLDELSDDLGSMPVVWLARVGSEPVGIEVTSEPLLRVALTHFVTRAADLMLTTRDLSDGICVELNYLPTGANEYQILSWGVSRARGTT